MFYLLVVVFILTDILYILKLKKKKKIIIPQRFDTSLKNSIEEKFYFVV